MRHFENIPGLEITKVANGWIVDVPLKGHAIMPLPMRDYKMQASIMREECTKDPALDDIVQEEETLEIELPIDKGVYIFLTFKEVLTFLKARFE